MNKLFLVLLLVFGILFFGCKKDEGTPTEPDNQNNPPQEQQSGIILGTIKTEFGTGLPDVQVTAGGKTIPSNDQGWFSIVDLQENARVQVTFRKEGYVTTHKITEVVIGQSSFLEVVMASQNYPTSVSGSAGGSVFDGSAKVDFPANSFVGEDGVPYNGSAKIYADYFDPTSSYYNDVFPGDFKGVPAGGSAEVPIESYGFMDVNLETEDGANLKLASGKTATLTIPIASSMAANAPATIPLWYYDTVSGKWKEEGYATKDGDKYVGTVTHFTAWNCDMTYNICYIEGRVVDEEGNPVAGARVGAEGVDYTGESTTNTGSDGTFRVGVRPNSHIKVTASKSGSYSTPVDVNPTPAQGGSQDIGDIVLAPPVASITLTWGEEPWDLDSHILVPASGDFGPAHVYFGNQGSITSYPFVELDTDDVTSYGPEIISILRKYPGVYKYAVHNFSGEMYGPLTESQANITLIIGSSLYTFSVPDSNPNGYNVWHVFDLNVAENGAVTITTVNQFEDYSTTLGQGGFYKEPVTK